MDTQETPKTNGSAHPPLVSYLSPTKDEEVRQMAPETDESVEELMKQFLRAQIIASQKPSNGNGGSKWTSWIQTGVICALLLVNGTNRFTTGEGDLKQELAVQKTVSAQQAVTIGVLSDRVQSVEYIFANTRQQFAALGIQVDPKTGDITVKRSR